MDCLRGKATVQTAAWKDTLVICVHLWQINMVILERDILLLQDCEGALGARRSQISVQLYNHHESVRVM